MANERAAVLVDVNPWRCERCGRVLGNVVQVDGRPEMKLVEKLHAKVRGCLVVFECPDCERGNVWIREKIPSKILDFATALC